MRILYFVRGNLSPAKAKQIQHSFISQYGDDLQLAFRDADKPVTIIEDCDAIAGIPPVEYRRIFEKSEPTESIALQEDVESFELPVISRGARALIEEYKISDAELATIIPTGKNGIIQRDIEKYLE